MKKLFFIMLMLPLPFSAVEGFIIGDPDPVEEFSEDPAFNEVHYELAKKHSETMTECQKIATYNECFEIYVYSDEFGEESESIYELEENEEESREPWWWP